MTPRCHRHRTPTRRGTIYLLVLTVSTIVTMVGLSALTLTRVQRRIRVDKTEAAAAHRLALSGLEHGLLEFRTAVAAARNGGADWRQGFTNGLYTGKVSFESGTYCWRLVDEDGDLRDDPLDSVSLEAVGEAGEAVQRLGVRLDPPAGTEPLSCLQSTFHTGKQLEIDGATIVSDGLLSSNADVLTNGADVTADVEAAGIVVDDAITGSVAQGVAARAMPGSRVFDYYLSVGTRIELAPLAHRDHFDLQDVVLSPFSNPYGPTNPEGIYILDCQGADLRIKNCRIVGTLVLLDPDPISKIEQAISWEPAIPSYPAALVRGSMTWKVDDRTLDENLRWVNFNPPGTPYQGVTNETLGETYPSIISGLIYVSGDLTVSLGKDAETGLREGPTIVAGAVATWSNVSVVLTADDRSWLDPPPGFRVAVDDPTVVTGTLVRLVD